MKLNPSEKNAVEALEYVLHACRVKVTTYTIRERLYLHPDFPSMAALSDVLNEWKVPHVAARISVKQLREVPLPALAFLEINGGYFAPLKKVSGDGEVEWLDTGRGWQKENLSTFAQKWSGVTLMLEPGTESGERNFKQRRRESALESARKPFLILGILALILGLVFLFTENTQPVFWSLKALLVVKLMGTIVTSLPLWSSVDADNPLLRMLCGVNHQSTCSSILNSEASRLWGWLRWSEIGFVYFSGGALALGGAWVTGRSEALAWLYLLSVLALPYTFYSMYYQDRVARQWCTPCLVVQALLWVEFFVVISWWRDINFTVNLPVLALLMIAFLVPALLWVGIKRPLKEAGRVYPLLRELTKTKFNPGYVASLFNRSPDMPPLFSDMKTVLLGNPDAAHSLTIVTNPLCGPCVCLHGELKQLLADTDEINCRLVFTGPRDAQRIAEVLLSLPAGEVENALHDWCEDVTRDVRKWLKKWSSVEISREKRSYQLAIHSRWIQIARIRATPTVFLNGITPVQNKN